MTDSWINDLRFAASVVRSVESDNRELNFELRLLADRIEVLIGEIRQQDVQPNSDMGVTGESD